MTDVPEADHGFDPNASRLLTAARVLQKQQPEVFGILSIDPKNASSDQEFLVGVLVSALDDREARIAARNAARHVFEHDPEVPRASLMDVSVSSRRNFEPGGEVSTLLFSRGVHAILAHRVVHALWIDERRELALALKTVFGRAFSTDIHPGARFGRGIWLDHGLGFVVGETSIIEDGVSIWHGVTMGSTLKDGGPTRHPRLRRGCTIGADTIILGDVDIGEGSVVAAGSVVLASVPPGTTVAGVPARAKVRSSASFSGF